MIKYFVITFLLLFVKPLICSGSTCDNWDHAGSTATGDELCENDFKYDMYGCLKLTKKIQAHKGKREFGQKCSVSGGGEDACLLLAPGTDWRWKNFSTPSLKYEVADCHRRTNLICHGYYNRCYCGTKKNAGEYYQYDKGQHACVVRPGFPCENEFDCANGTICSRVIIGAADPQYVCNCNQRIRFLEDDDEFEERFLVVNTTHWDNWYCTYSKTPPVTPSTRRKVKFSFTGGTATIVRVSSVIFQFFILTTGAYITSVQQNMIEV